jgi:hypothetical protein
MIDLTEKPTDAQVKASADILRSWHTLNEAGPKMEDRFTVGVLVRCELAGKRRLNILNRLIARYSALEGRENEQELRRALSRR